MHKLPIAVTQDTLPHVLINEYSDGMALSHVYNTMGFQIKHVVLCVTF